MVVLFMFLAVAADFLTYMVLAVLLPGDCSWHLCN